MDQLIQDKMESVVAKVKAYHPNPDIDLLRRAMHFAAECHAPQVRKSGEPYILHPLEVSEIICELRLDIHGVCAGVLHDVVEDCDVTVEQIAEMFNEDIAFIVNGVTKLSKYEFSSKQQRQAESMRKMFVAMASDIRVILVKLCDRVHNMRTLRHMKKEKQVEIAKETLDIYAPLANRLGIQWIKSELEDMAFRYIYEDEYYLLAEKVALKKVEREDFITDTIALIQSKLKEHEIYADVYGRPKHFFSIWKKMKQNGIDFEQVYDVLAFRVLTSSLRDCYGVLGIIHSMWKPVPGRFKDYVGMPKPNGYQSLHTSVIGPQQERIEIQIRTEEMHKVAEQGVAAHWQYKEGRVVPDDDANKFAWLRQIMEWQQDLADPTEFVDLVKVDMFSDEIFALTPGGEIKPLPRGATPLDFAYAVHTEVGHHCTGARINGQIVPLRHELKTGDTVHILTHPTARPNPDWLKWVKTGRARTKIRHYIRAEQREKNKEYGRELLEKELKKFGRTVKKLIKNGEMLDAARSCKFQNIDDLFVNVGYGKIQPETVLKRLVPEEEREKPKEEGRLSKLFKAITPQKKKRPGIALDGVEDVMVKYARCCSPVPGEKITGFITRGRGLTIHASQCPHLEHLEPDRLIDVYWDTTPDATRPVNVRVLCNDAPGLLANISQSFTGAGVNIAQAHCRTLADNRAINSFEIHVSDMDQLEKALTAIKRIKGVYSVERVRA